MTSTDASVREFSFIKGVENVVAPKDGNIFQWNTAAARVREHLHDALNAKNLAFLFGSGCSSVVSGIEQKGIPTMGPLAAEFLKPFSTSSQQPPGNPAPAIVLGLPPLPGSAPLPPVPVPVPLPPGTTLPTNPAPTPPDNELTLPTAHERTVLIDALGFDIASPEFSNNLERLMEALYSFQFVLKRSTSAALIPAAGIVESLIKKVTKFVTARCSTGSFATGDDTLVRLYQSFYRKLAYRDRTLPRPWVFTTNYDLFSETAMDRLGMPYCNGFSGTVERRFNPTTYRYALAEQLDLTSRKWAAVDSFIYLCKLHGSINWVEEGGSLFPIREVTVDQAQGADRVMIYPTPMKQNASFGSPYSDLFREFQARVVKEQTVLIVVGYSFGDEHVNNIIFQALTIPSFRLVALLPPDAAGIPKKLRELNDPRIWFIGGDGPDDNDSRAHYFDTFVEKFMPEAPEDKVDTAVERVLRELIAQGKAPDAGELGSP